jgi:LuxR family maltose regulon positive regulatory protein
VTAVSAPPGSGKTILLRSWIGEAALTDRVACVAVGRDERDPQRFWLSVLQTYVPERMATDPVGWVVR